MKKQVKISQEVEYAGHSLSANGSVNLSLKAGYAQLVPTLQLTQMLNNDVVVKAKMEGEKPMQLGGFRIKNISIDGDGESKIKLNGLADYVEMDNLNRLPLKDEDGVVTFTARYEAGIEREGGDEDGNAEEE